MNKKLVLAMGFLTAVSANVYAHELDNTSWRTIDDSSGKDKAVLSFKKQSDGTYKANVTQVLEQKALPVCGYCAGEFKNKTLLGITMVTKLQKVGEGKYDKGNIVDPESARNYGFKAEFSPDGKKLNVRGYLGVSLLGRNQTWHKVN